MSYATPQNMLNRYDTNRLGELVVDGESERKTAVQLLTDDVLQAMLNDADGWIDAACLTGKRYLPEDLAGLTGSGLQLLVRLACDLAYGFLLQRRGYPDDQVQNLAPGFNRALQMLQNLRDGERIFPLDDQAQAGVEVDMILKPGPNSGVYRLTKEAERYFGDLCLPRTPDDC